jgi:5S rRNA maturation endonuclease (ribonuclease M5)
MNYRGRNLNWFQLWSNYCDKLDPSQNGGFHPPVMCPNPNHDNHRSPAFQINISRPLVCCFSNCGMNGSYEHGISVLEGFYDEFNVNEQDITNAKKKREAGEAREITISRAKVSKAHKKARRIILKYTNYPNLGGEANSRIPATKKARTNFHDLRVDGVEEIKEDDLLKYSYMPKEAISYLESRGINPDSRAKWQLGFDMEAHRITIPVRDSRGRLRFIIRRGILDSQRPKYLYPPEAPKKALLMGYGQLDRGMIESFGLVVVEGSLDCIRLHQHEYRSTVAILGSSLSSLQRKLIFELRPKKIYVFMDKDRAGLEALWKIVPQLEAKVQVRIPTYPKGLDFDPAKLTAEQLEHSFEKSISLLTLNRRYKEKLAKSNVYV